jgi:hypothetical protein
MVNLSAAPSGDPRAAQARPMASSNDLTTMLSGQLQAAARSVGNLNAVGGSQNNGFYERISSRLNEVLSEIDNEIFTSGEYVIGASSVSAQEQNTDPEFQDVSDGGGEPPDHRSNYGSASKPHVGARVRQYFQFYGC